MCALLFTIKFCMMQSLPSPRTLMCHLPYHMMPGGNHALSPAKYIYVMRNPKDVAVSYYHHMKHVTRFNYTSEFDVYFESFIKGNVFYGLWFDHVFEWTKHRDILFLLRYVLYQLFIRC